jgi:CubicO group peptidase (beta-lactamase class C family)
VLAAGGWLASQALPVGLGHKAKTLCSGVFVSRLDAPGVLADLETGDFAALRYIDASIDAGARFVTASFLGMVTRRAVYREALGCALMLDDLRPPALPGDQRPHGLFAEDSAADKPPALLDAAVAGAFSEPDPQHPRRTLAAVVMHRGRIVAERYATGIGPDTALPGWSMTKSVINALVGILVREGRLKIDAPVPLPEWRGDARAAITLDHLLRMSSGLHVSEGIVTVRSDLMRMLFASGDVAAFAAGRDLEAAPGSRFQYDNGTSNIISRVLRDAMRDREDYLTFPRRALFDRIGMSSAVLETDAAGTFVGSSYMFATARDWARFGALYLEDGVWNGERILPEGWVAYTTSPAPADPQKSYGAHFALEIPIQYAWKDARLPAKAFHAVGHEGQFVTIVPSRELLIVRLGRTRHRGAWDHAAFVRDVIAALDRSAQ